MIESGCEHVRWVDNGPAFAARGRLRCVHCGGCVDYQLWPNLTIEGGPAVPVVPLPIRAHPWPASWPANQPMFSREDENR